MTRLLLTTLLIVAVVAAFVGCSNNPAGPENQEGMSPTYAIAQGSDNGSVLWGLWTIVLDPADPQVIPLRTAEFNLNILCFLEPPALANLQLISGPNIHPDPQVADVTIGLKHPFVGLTEFTGFDVKGIVVTNGNYYQFRETTNKGNKVKVSNGTTDLTYPVLQLVNADGYSDCFNPVEYPYDDTWSSYKDGMLGAPDSWAHFSHNVNPYKYFCHGLGEGIKLDTFFASSLNLNNRGVFLAGETNKRTYELKSSKPWTEAIPVFNYIVAASWDWPSLGTYPWTAPDDFPINANQEEPLFLSVNTSGPGLKTNGTGSLTVECLVHDWQSNPTGVTIDSPVTASVKDMADGGGGNFSLAISNETGVPAGSYPILVTAESAGTEGKSYQIVFVDVVAEANMDWATPVKVADVSGNTSSNEVLPFGIVVNGTYWLFWMEGNGATKNLRCRRYDGSTWYPPTSSQGDLVVDIPGYGNGQPRFVADGNILHGIFADSYLSHPQVFYVRIDTTSSFPFPLTGSDYEVISNDVPPSFIESRTGDITIDSTGNISIVWAYRANPPLKWQVWMRDGLPGSWNPAVKLTPDSYAYGRPKIEMDTSDLRHVVFDRYLSEESYYWDYDNDPGNFPSPFTGSYYNSSLLINDGMCYIGLYYDGVFYSKFAVDEDPPEPLRLTYPGNPITWDGNLAVCGSSVVLMYIMVDYTENIANISGVILDGSPLIVSLTNILPLDTFDYIHDLNSAVDQTKSKLYIAFVGDDGTGANLWFTEASY